MSGFVNITINNRNHLVRANASVLQACEEASYDVPRFCYHEKLSVAGNCRMCLVEVQKSPKPVVSCAMPVSKGMVIYTDSPLVRKAREAVLEFLLINHPLDCPICDQGGECDLQDETLQYGADRGRYYEFKRSVEDKECGPIIKTIMTRCIHCTRCIRFAAEVAGQETLGSFGRGQETEIGTYVQSFIHTELSGNLVDLCPVGALTSKPYAFVARSWELQRVDTIDFFDAICSDISVQSRKLTSTKQKSVNNYKNITHEEIIRILPRNNTLFPENWISDKSRYAFDGLRNQRAVHPQYKNRKGNNLNLVWSEILPEIAQRLETTKTGNQRLVGILGNLLDLESLYALSIFMKLNGSSDIQYGFYTPKVNVDAPIFFGLNRTLSSFEDENFGSLLLIGTNLRFEASLLNTILRRQQTRRALPYATVNSFAPQRLRQHHLGNSLKTLVGIAQGKSSLGLRMANSYNPSIILGFESLKGQNGFFITNLFRFIAKKFVAKTLSGERFGIIHSTVTSLNACYLGLTPGVRSSLHVESKGINKNIGMLFNLQTSDIPVPSWLHNTKEYTAHNNYTHVISLTTSKTFSTSADYIVPLKSLYEKDFFALNVENRIRRGYRSVTAPKEARSIEAFFLALLALTNEGKKWLDILPQLWNLEKEVPLNRLLEKVPAPFMFNPFFVVEESFTAKIAPFYPTILNFYLNDVISSSSATMGECALFLAQENNFVQEQ